MSSLLQQFHDEISLRGYSARTRNAYLYAITQLLIRTNTFGHLAK